MRRRLAARVDADKLYFLLNQPTQDPADLSPDHEGEFINDDVLEGTRVRRHVQWVG